MFKILNPFAFQCYNVVFEALVLEIRRQKEVKVMAQVGKKWTISIWRWYKNPSNSPTTDIWQRCQNACPPTHTKGGGEGERTAFSTNGVGKTGCHSGRTKLDHIYHPSQKLTMWTKGPKVKLEILKVLEENKVRTLKDTGVEKNFLNKTLFTTSFFYSLTLCSETSMFYSNQVHQHLSKEHQTSHLLYSLHKVAKPPQNPPGKHPPLRRINPLTCWHAEMVVSLQSTLYNWKSPNSF